VGRVADLELGLTQQLGVGLLRQQAGQAARLLKERPLEQLEEALGLGLLLGGKRQLCHGTISLRGGFLVDVSRPAYVRNFPPPFETPTPQLADGLLTRAVTGYEEDGQMRFAAYWSK
jgi:hypothetical protein